MSTLTGARKGDAVICSRLAKARKKERARAPLRPERVRESGVTLSRAVIGYKT